MERRNSPYLNHFLSADTIVSAPYRPQSLNRYSYVVNNPINAIDPTGHLCVGEPEECLENDGFMSGGFNGTGGSVSNPGAGNCSGSGCQGNGNDDEDDSDPIPDPPTPSITIDPLEQYSDYGCQTVTCRALNGDVYSMIQLLLPSHLGWRIQIEGTVFIFSGTVGINGVYNFVNDEFGGNVDWSLGGGPGVGAGLAVTTGPLAGWGSSNVNVVTSGNSVVVSGSAAAEWAATGAISVPVNENGFYVDPYYGQIPATLYFGGGVGGAFADAGLTGSGTFLTFP